mmetsp:Transcript_5473/g.7649  ORF Transcript_5473/g.7649 Transcript_5473/m.7649 type:complete len:339 (-) Transcript_5473:88-1104(-)
MRAFVGLITLSLLGFVLCDNVVTISNGKLLVFKSSGFSSSSSPIQSIYDPEGGSFASVKRYRDYVYTVTGDAHVQRWGISTSGKLYRTSDYFWFQYCPTGLTIRGSTDPENADYVMLICPYYSYGNSRVVLANPKTLEFEYNITSTNTGTSAGIIFDAVLTGNYLYTSELTPHEFGYGKIVQYSVNNDFKKSTEVKLAAHPSLAIRKNSDLFATISTTQLVPAVNDIMRFDADRMTPVDTLSTTCTDLVRLSSDSKTLFVACDNNNSLKVYDVSGSGIEPVCESDLGSGVDAGMKMVDGFLYGAGSGLTRYTLGDNGCPVSADVVPVTCTSVDGLSEE